MQERDLLEVRAESAEEKQHELALRLELAEGRHEAAQGHLEAQGLAAAKERAALEKDVRRAEGQQKALRKRVQALEAELDTAQRSLSQPRRRTT